MQYKLFDEFKFFCFGSGSSGNCYYLGAYGCGLLIDAGIGIRSLESVLKKHNIDFSEINALLITHEHIDHIKAAKKIARKYNIAIYATSAVNDLMKSSDIVTCDISKNIPFRINHFNVTAFTVPHDSCDNSGFMINYQDQTLVYITDAGEVTQTMLDYARKANHLIIEANYDKDMLQDGKYPYYLKKRVSGGRGHLSNIESGELIAHIHHANMRNVFLCHLSKNNNTPDKALNTVRNILERRNIDISCTKIEVL